VAPLPGSELDMYINEFMASNSDADTDEYGETDDWIEVYNHSGEAIDLGGMFVTDDLTNLARYRIPTTNPSLTTVAADSFVVIWADNQPEQGPLHTNFKLSASGESIALVETDGASVVDHITFAGQSGDISYGRLPDGADTWQFLGVSTPGASNRDRGMLPPFPGHSED
jgi:hypothetical protein